MKIKRFVERGEFSRKVKTVDSLMDEAAGLLDGACATEILGPVLFQGEDGKWYTVTVEAVVGKASPGFVRDTLEERKAENAGQRDGTSLCSGPAGQTNRPIGFGVK